MNMNCEQSRALVPGYLDGELGEALAAPLRSHLLACLACRDVAQGQRAQATWFQPGEPPAIPHGFAARVARLAFEGVGPSEGVTLIPRPAAGPQATAGSDPPQFLVWATAIAAAVLFMLSIELGGRDLPTSDTLYADTQLSDVLDDLDRLHAEDAKPAGHAPEAATRGDRPADER